MKYAVLAALACLSLATVAQADPVIRASGSVIDQSGDKVTFKNVRFTPGRRAHISFDYSIWARNSGQIDQLLVSVNGKIVEFVFNGTVGSGKKGRASVSFNPSQYARGAYTVEIGLTAATSTSKARHHYEKENGGYRISVVKSSTN